MRLISFVLLLSATVSFSQIADATMGCPQPLSMVTFSMGTYFSSCSSDNISGGAAMGNWFSGAMTAKLNSAGKKSSFVNYFDANVIPSTLNATNTYNLLFYFGHGNENGCISTYYCDRMILPGCYMDGGHGLDNFGTGSSRWMIFNSCLTLQPSPYALDYYTQRHKGKVVEKDRN